MCKLSSANQISKVPAVLCSSEQSQPAFSPRHPRFTRDHAGEVAKATLEIY